MHETVITLLHTALKKLQHVERYVNSTQMFSKNNNLRP